MILVIRNCCQGNFYLRKRICQEQSKTKEKTNENHMINFFMFNTPEISEWSFDWIDYMSLAIEFEENGFLLVLELKLINGVIYMFME